MHFNLQTQYMIVDEKKEEKDICEYGKYVCSSNFLFFVISLQFRLFAFVYANRAGRNQFIQNKTWKLYLIVRRKAPATIAPSTVRSTERLITGEWTSGSSLPTLVAVMVSMVYLFAVYAELTSLTSLNAARALVTPLWWRPRQGCASEHNLRFSARDIWGNRQLLARSTGQPTIPEEVEVGLTRVRGNDVAVSDASERMRSRVGVSWKGREACCRVESVVTPTPVVCDRLLIPL